MKSVEQVPAALDPLTNPKLDPSEYNRIVEGLSLHLIRLSAAECKSQWSTGEKKLRFNTDLRAEYRVVDADNVLITMRCRFVAKDEDSNEDEVSILATYEITTHSESEFTPEFFEIYQAINLSSTIWPYFREFVQSTIARMALPPLSLPFLVRMGPAHPPDKPKKTRANG